MLDLNNLEQYRETNRVEAKRDMLDKNPSLRGSYDENDDNTIVLFCRNAHATISSFTADPVTFEF